MVISGPDGASVPRATTARDRGSHAGGFPAERVINRRIMQTDPTVCRRLIGSFRWFCYLEPVSVRVLELARMSVGYGCRLATRTGQPQKLPVGSASSSARSGAGVAAAGTSSIRCQRVLRSAQYSRQRPPPGGGGA